MPKYNLWFAVDQCYEIKAENEDKAIEIVMSGEADEDSIVDECNQEWFKTEKIKTKKI